MLEIQASDLKVKRYKENSKATQERTTAKALAELTVELKKKDMAIEQLTQTVSMLNLEIEKLKGGSI